MKEQIYTYRTYYLLVFVAFLFGLTLSFLLPKGTFVMLWSEHRTQWQDMFFKTTNYNGEWIGGSLIAVFFLLKKKYDLFFSLLISVLLTFLIVQGLKHFVFYDMHRPAVFFGDSLKPVQGTTLNRHFAFPSGHTSSSFSIFTTLVFLFRSHIAQALVFLFALFGGLSRIYLGQHFVMDVTAGILIGTAIATCVYFFYSSWSQKRRSQ